MARTDIANIMSVLFSTNVAGTSTVAHIVSDNVTVLLVDASGGLVVHNMPNGSVV